MALRLRMCDARIPRSSVIALNTGRLSGRPNAKIEHRYREFSKPSSVSRSFGGFIAQQFSSSQSAVAPGRRSSRLP
jgi:hypothetical protein